MNTVNRAKNFAYSKHFHQKDDSGLSYFSAHILQVVHILEQVTDDEVILSAAYLHDTIEDTNTTYEELTKEFGKEIADLVMEVTHEGKKDNYGRYFPRLHSQRGILIKFADRLSNLSRMQPWNEERRQHYLKKSKFWKDGSDLVGVQR